jgi:aspartate aminotransferase
MENPNENPDRRFPRLSRLANAVEPSATLSVDAKAKALKAAGRDVIGFGAGEPDFDPPEEALNKTLQSLHEKSTHKYSPVAGLPELRELIARPNVYAEGVSYDPSQVLVTNGAKQAIFNACSAILNEGDEVIIIAPFWSTYAEVVKFNGAEAVFITASEKDGFKVSPHSIERQITHRTKLIIFNSPCNPTGAVYNKNELRQLGLLAREKNIWVISDDIYRNLIYPPDSYNSMLNEVPELYDKYVIIDGASKTYAMTGWRVGWMLGPVDVINAATDIQSQTTSNVSNFAQNLAISAFLSDKKYIEDGSSKMLVRRNKMHEMLTSVEGIKCNLPQGAFYCFPNVASYIGVNIRGKFATNTLELAQIILEEANVAVVPGEAFGAPGYFRLTYAMDEDLMQEGLNRIIKLFSEVS